MIRYMPWIAAPFFALAACDSDSGSSDTTDTTGGDTTTGDTNVPAGTSALTGVNTNVTVTAPTRNAACDNGEVDNANHGAKYPWGGLTVGTTNYTCNACPGGLEALQGQWRFFLFDNDDNEDYTSPAASDYAEVVYIDGNTWYTKIYDSQASPKTVEARGYYACLQQPEHPNKHLLWVTLEATPTGAQGWSAGEAFGSDVPLIGGASGKDWRAYWYNDPRDTNADFNKTTGGDDEKPYCQFGSSAGGKTCSNPF